MYAASMSTVTKPTVKQLPPLAKARQFSEATGIPERAIRRALNRGDLPGTRIASVWYVNTAAALALLGLSE